MKRIYNEQCLVLLERAFLLRVWPHGHTGISIIRFPDALKTSARGQKEGAAKVWIFG